ncbi:MAG: heme exporter protein CcmB [Salinivenus sp.]
MDWLAGSWAVFRKDVRIELRTRYAVNALLLFALGALLLILFAVGPQPIATRIQAAFLWMVILFAAAVGLGRSFGAEERDGTALLLRLNTRPSMVFAGKLLFNLVLVGSLGVVTTGALLLLLDVSVERPGLLALALGLGVLGLAVATTLLGALVARAARRGALLPVLLLPLLTPLLVASVGATRKAIRGLPWTQAQDELLTLVGFVGASLSAATVLFDYVWEE